MEDHYRQLITKAYMNSYCAVLGPVTKRLSVQKRKRIRRKVCLVGRAAIAFKEIYEAVRYKPGNTGYEEALLEYICAGFTEDTPIPESHRLDTID